LSYYRWFSHSTVIQNILDRGYRAGYWRRILFKGKGRNSDPEPIKSVRSRQKISVADPDPGSGAFLTPGSGMGKNQDPEIRDEQPGSYFRELRNHFFGLKYLNSLMQIRDPEWKNSDPGSGMEKNSDPRSAINIPNPQHCGDQEICSKFAKIFLSRELVTIPAAYFAHQKKGFF
jgi:hypothetical protein